MGKVSVSLYGSIAMQKKLRMERLEERTAPATSIVGSVIDYSPGRGAGGPWTDVENIYGSGEYDEGRPGSYLALGEGGSVTVELSEPISIYHGAKVRFLEKGAKDNADVFLSADHGETWYKYGTIYGSGHLMLGWRIGLPAMQLDLPEFFFSNPGYITTIRLVDDGSRDSYTNEHAGYDLDAIDTAYKSGYVGFLPGDANKDGLFDTTDIGQVVLGNKYGTGEDAAWEEGDWNADGVFDQLDLVEAMSESGRYFNYAAKL
jgi:hypothetical protein